MMKNLRSYKLRISIVNFGAKSGSNELQTESIQSAIDFCFKKGGGEIIVPAGEYLTGGIRLRSNTTLHLLEGAKIIGSRNPNDYNTLQKDKIEPVPSYLFTNETKINGRSIDGMHFGRRWFNSLIKVYKAKNVSIIGENGSLIDGRDCYDDKGEEGYRGPHCICVAETNNINFLGVNVINSANWAYCIWNCKNITSIGGTIKGGHDGFDVFGCKNVIIDDCDFNTGDDCIAGYANYKVKINNCRLSSACNAFRFAGNKVKISNCKINGNSKYVHRYFLTDEEKKTGVLLTDEENPKHRYRMKSFFTYYADCRLKIKKKPSKIVIENCTIDSPEKFLHYNYSGNEVWQKNKPLYDITFKNVSAKNLSVPIVAYGDKDVPFEFSFNNVAFELSKDYSDDCLIRSANLKKVVFNGFVVNNFLGKTVLRNYGKNKGRIILNNSNFGVENAKLIEEVEDTFTVEWI
ncbi:MAG: hypothetical protein J6U92_01660 [Clostridia bacterium]|nr:hypothetical protein [Clostridia bacterium]